MATRAKAQPHVAFMAGIVCVEAEAVLRADVQPMALACPSTLGGAIAQAACKAASAEVTTSSVVARRISRR